MTRREKRELEQAKAAKKEKKVKFNASHVLKIAVCAVSIIFLVAVGFFIDTFAPANPKCYHRWVLSSFHGSYNAKGCPETYMQFNTLANTETGERATKYIWTRVTVTEGAGVNEIWINVSDLYEDKAVIKIRTGKSESNTVLLKQYTLTAEELKKSKDGWIKIYDLDKGDKPHTSTYNQTFCIGFETEIRLREIGYVGNYGYDTQIEEWGTAIDEIVNADASSSEESEGYKICDEKSTFPYAPLSEEE